MIPTQPTTIPVPFAQNGQRNQIQTDAPGGAQPDASWQVGFPAITMIPREAGGKPPMGRDFNGILHTLSQHAYFSQSGGVYPWQATLNYLAGAHILGSNGKEYIALLPNGPDIPASGGGYVGAQNPITATTYWILATTLYGANYTPPVASTTQRGVARQATSAEAQNGATTGTSPAFVTPEQLKAYGGGGSVPVASTTVRGIVRQSTDTEAQNGTTTGTIPAFVTPEQLKAYGGGGGGGVVMSANITASGTWTAPASASYLIFACGGGGGGGGGNYFNRCYGGGAGGATTVSWDTTTLTISGGGGGGALSYVQSGGGGSGNSAVIGTRGGDALNFQGGDAGIVSTLDTSLKGSGFPGMGGDGLGGFGIGGKGAFSSYVHGGDGGNGAVRIFPVYLSEGTSLTIAIGAGGSAGGPSGGNNITTATAGTPGVVQIFRLY